MNEFGEVTQTESGYEARLERYVAHGQHELWKMLTDSEKLPRWLAPGFVEQRQGGQARIDFEMSGSTIDSTVTAVDPPSLLEYSWSSGDAPHRPLRWELSPEGAGVRLTLTLQLPIHENVPIACAGWEAHLDMLLAALEGVPISFPVQRFKEARGYYEELVPQS